MRIRLLLVQSMVLDLEDSVFVTFILQTQSENLNLYFPDLLRFVCHNS